MDTLYCLDEHQVHIWHVSMANFPRDRSCFDILSPAEQERAARFHFPQDRDQFLLTRYVLRQLAGHYLGLEPQSVNFEVDYFGKPHIPNYCDFQFNISHSAEIILIAFCRTYRIGIDVEQMRPLADADQIAATFFSGAECDDYRLTPDHLRQEAFFNCWTRKEAFIKAVGKGLAYPLDSFQVSLRPDQHPALLSIQGEPERRTPWTLISFDPAPNYKAALVIEGDSWALSHHNWP
jgi:4'-phosphopantetheinyl transferase